VDDKRATVRTLRDQGLTLAAIGQTLGLTRERVRQLLLPFAESFCPLCKTEKLERAGIKCCSSCRAEQELRANELRKTETLYTESALRQRIQSGDKLIDAERKALATKIEKLKKATAYKVAQLKARIRRDKEQLERVRKRNRG